LTDQRIEFDIQERVKAESQDDPASPSSRSRDAHAKKGCTDEESDEDDDSAEFHSSDKDSDADSSRPDKQPSSHPDDSKGYGYGNGFVLLEAWNTVGPRLKNKKTEQLRSSQPEYAGSDSKKDPTKGNTSTKALGDSTMSLGSSLDGSSGCFFTALKKCLRVSSKLVMPPSSRKVFTWELTGLGCIIFDLCWIPMKFLDPAETASTRAAAWIVRVFWSFNIWISFITGYLDHKGVSIMDPMKIGVRYAKTWLLFDVVVVILDWLELLVADDLKDGDDSFFQAARILICIRLLRVLRLRKLLRQAVRDIRSETFVLFLTIGKIILAMLFLTHLIACLWYGIGQQGSYATSWVKHLRLQDQSLGERYMWSFHCAISLLVGEHVVLPRSLSEQAFCSAVLFLCMLISAWFVSSITTAMTRLHIIASQKSSQFSALKRYLSDNKISRELAAKVQRNAHYALTEKKRNAPESSIELLMIISDPLRSELHYEVYSPILLVHPFFKCYAEIQTVALRKICHLAIGRLSFGTGDIVFTDGESPAVPRMYLVVKGKLLYVQEHYQDATFRSEAERKTIVEKQDWLSEAVLWTEWTHVGTLKAGVDVQLLTLDAQKFLNVAVKFPSLEVKTYATGFIELLHASKMTDLTDVSNNRDIQVDLLAGRSFPDGNAYQGSFFRTSMRNSIGDGGSILRPRGSIMGIPGRRSSVGGDGGRISQLMAPALSLQSQRRMSRISADSDYVAPARSSSCNSWFHSSQSSTMESSRSGNVFKFPQKVLSMLGHHRNES
jgi:hypothetical protein